MPINESIYGSPSSWDSSTSNQFITDFKIVDYGTNQHTLQDAVALGKFNKDTPIDKSIAFMGIGKECNYSNPKYFTKENGELVIKEFAKRDVTNTALYIKGNTTTYYANSYRFGDSGTTLNSDININWNEVDKPNNINRPVQFIADFNIKNLVMLVYVICSATTTGSTYVYTLSDYSSHASQYPYIRRVYGVLYGVNAPYTSRRNALVSGTYDNSQISLSSLDSLKYDDKDIYRYTNTPYNASSRSNDITIIGTSEGLQSDSYDWLFYDCELENTSVLNNGYYYYSCQIVDYNSFKEIALKSAAQFGIYFTDNVTTARDGAYTDANMYIGLLDENGISHGQYAKGANTATALQNTWNSVRDSNYDYTKDVDTTNYDNSTIFYPQAATGAFTKSYVLNETQVNALAQEAYNAVSQAPADDSIENYNQRYFLTSNVIDCIISLKKFPCQPYFPQGPVQPIKIGAYQTNIQAYHLAYSVQQFDFIFSRSNNNTLFPVNGGDFRDYEPYTKCSISIPFCGNVEIPCAYAYRYDIKVSLLVDLITGACTAFVICNGDVIETSSGNCAIDLPLSGLQSATLDSQYNSLKQQSISNGISNGLGIVGGLVAIGVGIATGGAAAIAGGALAVAGSALKGAANEQAIDYEVNHMQAPFKTISTASGNISQAYDMRCKMLIKRPVIGDYDNEVYGKTIGFACLRNGKVKDFTGLTIGDIRVDNVINSNDMSPTDTEKQMIYNAFATGVIL